MRASTAKLLSEFEALKLEDQEFVRELILRLSAWDSGPLSDDVAAAAGDELATLEKMLVEAVEGPHADWTPQDLEGIAQRVRDK